MGKDIVTLRALEPEDVEAIYSWENDPKVWQYGIAHIPFSRYQLTQYILNANSGDIYADKQLRLIGEINGFAIGCIDLYDFDAVNHRAAIGILVDSKYRGKGYAKQLLTEIIKYSMNHLQLHQLYCMVGCENMPSYKVFSSIGFKSAGLVFDWIYNTEKECYEDAYFMQYIIKK